MRSAVLAVVLVAACAADEPPTASVPATVVHVDVSGTCDGVCEAVYDQDWCSYIPLLEPETRDVVVGSYWRPDELAALVQLQYLGTSAISAVDDPGQLDYTLAPGDVVEVHSIFGPSYDQAWLFYRIDSQGHIVDIDTRHLIKASANTLQFDYGGLTEIHTIDKPRPLNVQTQDPCVCCSAGRPLDLGVVFALVLLPLRRRRKLRA